MEKFLARERKIYDKELLHHKYSIIQLALLTFAYLLFVVVNRFDYLGWAEWFVFYCILAMIAYDVYRYRGTYKMISKIDDWYLKTRHEYNKKVEK